jgi:hypothetical protein
MIFANIARRTVYLSLAWGNLPLAQAEHGLFLMDPVGILCDISGCNMGKLNHLKLCTPDKFFSCYYFNR